MNKLDNLFYQHLVSSVMPKKEKVYIWPLIIFQGLYLLVVLIVLLGVLLGGCDTCFADTISDLVPIIIQAESSGNPNASDGQSFGLMGISECVLKDWNYEVAAKQDGNWFNLRDMFWPSFNIKIGTWYLYKIQSQLPDEYKNSKPHIIFAYNSGLSKLRKLNWKIPSWTKNHPNKIYRKIYRGEEIKP